MNLMQMMIFFRKKDENVWKLRKKSYLCIAFEKESTSERSFGEVAEWSIAAVLKTVVLRGTGGSNPSLSAKWCKSSVCEIYTFFYTQKSTTGVAFTGQRIFRGSIYLGTVGI